MDIILASSERFSGCIVESLTRQGHRVVGAVSPRLGILEHQLKGPRFFINEMRGWNLLKVCKKQKIDLRVSRYLEDGSLQAFFKSKKADLLILFGWPTMVRASTTALFPRGAMNVHPSLLPRLRGADPLFDLVDLCEEKLGLTFHKVVDELDAGPIYCQKPLPFSRLDTYDDLYFKILNGIYRYLPGAIEALVRKPKGVPQTGEPSMVRRFQQDMRILDPTVPFEKIRRRSLACFSHHSRLTGVGNQLIHFTSCKELHHFEEKYPQNGSLQRSDLLSMVVKLDRRMVRLTGVRFQGRPTWMTPYLLATVCKPGMVLADRDAVAAMIQRDKPE